MPAISVNDVVRTAKGVCKSRGLRIVVALAALLLVLFWILRSPLPRSAGEYRIIEIPPQEDHIRLLALNDSGQAAGYMYGESQPQSRAIIWDAKNGIQLLATPDGHSSKARDINNSGQVCGTLRDPNNRSHACFWDSEGRVHDIGTLRERTSMANGLNDHGQVVGWSWISPRKRHAFLWTTEKGITDLGARGGTDSEAEQINNHGQIVGQLWTSSGRSHTFIWQEDAGMVDIQNKLDGTDSVPLGINDSGHIIGTYLRKGGPWRAFVLDDKRRFRDLGISSEDDFGCYPAAITDRGQAIAKMQEPASRKLLIIKRRRCNLSFLFDHKLRRMHLHKALPFETDLCVAHDMNNKGQIIVRASKDRTTKWYLITPVAPDNGKAER